LARCPADTQAVIQAIHEKGYDAVLSLMRLEDRYLKREVPATLEVIPVTYRDPWYGRYYTAYRQVIEPARRDREAAVSSRPTCGASPRATAAWSGGNGEGVRVAGQQHHPGHGREADRAGARAAGFVPTTRPADRMTVSQRQLPDGRVELVDPSPLESSRSTTRSRAGAGGAPQLDHLQLRALWISMRTAIPTYMLASGPWRRA